MYLDAVDGGKEVVLKPTAIADVPLLKSTLFVLKLHMP